MTVLEVENWHGSHYYQAWRPLDDPKYWRDVEWRMQPVAPPPNTKLSHAAGWT
jgi:hypothetical protein